jgi:hypothetical protein
MIKKIIVIIVFHVIGLYGAANQVDVISYTTAEKQSLLLTYMFSKGFIDEIIPCVKPYNIVRRIESLQELRRLYQPGQQAYGLAKSTCRDICQLIQLTSLEHKESMVRLFIRYNVEPVIQNKLYVVQQALETAGPAQEQIKTQFTHGIKNLFNAFYLQQSLDIPLIEDRTFDIMYQQKIEQALEHLSRAVIVQASFEVEEPQIIKDLLSKNDIDSAEIDAFVAIAFDETKKILAAHLKQYDPHCGM